MSISKALAFQILFLILFSACKVTKDVDVKEMVSPPKLAHTVYFWMEDGVSAADKAKLEEGLKSLAKVPSIHSYYWGPPASTGKRDVVDNSYAYGINVFFESAADEAAYQIDPIHLEFIDKYKHLWTKVVVYDNIMN